MKTTTQYPKFNFLQSVVNDLRYSQGFYSRLAQQLDGLSEDDIANAESQLPDFKDKVDVVLFLEQ